MGQYFSKAKHLIRGHSFLNLTKGHDTFIGHPNIFFCSLPILPYKYCMYVYFYTNMYTNNDIKYNLFLSYPCLTYVSTKCGTDTEPKHHVWLTQHSDLKNRRLGILKRLEAWSFCHISVYTSWFFFLLPPILLSRPERCWLVTSDGKKREVNFSNYMKWKKLIWHSLLNICLSVFYSFFQQGR